MPDLSVFEWNHVFLSLTCEAECEILSHCVSPLSLKVLGGDFWTTQPRLNPPVIAETSHVPDCLCRLWGKVQSSGHGFGHSTDQTFTQAWEKAADSSLCLHPLHCGCDNACHASYDAWERRIHLHGHANIHLLLHNMLTMMAEFTQHRTAVIWTHVTVMTETFSFNLRVLQNIALTVLQWHLLLLFKVPPVSKA